MFKLIDSILQQFQICFKRKNTFAMFVIIVLGMMLRSDLRGVTSFVGYLHIKPKYYRSLLNFFRSNAYKLQNLKSWWLTIVMQKIQPVIHDDRIIIIGDHIKVTKEGKHMPGVKKHHQESENAGKSEYIFGHQFGVVGILAEGKTNQCIPVSVELHDGKINKHSFNTNKCMLLEEQKKESSVAKMIKMSENIIKTTKKDAIFLLDAYFASGNAFKIADDINNKFNRNAITLIMRGKTNTVAFNPILEKKGKKVKGAPS
jgi:hypothetical protein